MAGVMSIVEEEIIRALWRNPASWWTNDRLSDLTTFPAPDIESVVNRLRDEGLVTLFHTGRGVVAALANTREARAEAIRLTKEVAPPLSGAPSCSHHWLLERPDGDLTRGVCKLCGAERFFTGTVPRGPVSHGLVLARQPSRTLDLPGAS